MNERLRLSFWEREFFPGNRSGEHIAGYEPALVYDGKEVCEGHVVDLKRMRNADWEDREVYASEFPMKDISLDLEEVLSATYEGKRWLEAHQAFFRDVFQKYMPLPFSLKLVEMPSVHYVLFNDLNASDHLSSVYFRRIPCGTLATLPRTCFYGLVTIPQRFSDGKFAPSIYYNRNTLNGRGISQGYSLQLFPKEKFNYAPGILLGTLEENDVVLEQGNLHDETPLNHLLEVTYPVSMRDTSHCPLTICVELCSTEKVDGV